MKCIWCNEKLGVEGDLCSKCDELLKKYPHPEAMIEAKALLESGWHTMYADCLKPGDTLINIGVITNVELTHNNGVELYIEDYPNEVEYRSDQIVHVSVLRDEENERLATFKR